MRRATQSQGLQKAYSKNFYPRSPCGERLADRYEMGIIRQISIHALLAESDVTFEFYNSLCQDFYPRSPCGERRSSDIKKPCKALISIHALLAESDPDAERANQSEHCISIHALLAESDDISFYAQNRHLPFLSTLSLRRATRFSVFNLLDLSFLSTLSLRRATTERY